MYGHPAATRAAVTQAAHEIAIASPSQHRRNPSTSSRVERAHSVEVNVTETPLPGHQEKKTEPSIVSPSPNSQSHGHSHGSMNMRALLLHVMGDALGNIGVIVTGLIIWLTTWSGRSYLDPAVSLVITTIIFTSALPLGMSHHIYARAQGTHPLHRSSECFIHLTSRNPIHHIARRCSPIHPECGRRPIRTRASYLATLGI